MGDWLRLCHLPHHWSPSLEVASLEYIGLELSCFPQSKIGVLLSKEEGSCIDFLLYVTSYHKHSGFTQHNLFSYSSGGQKSEMGLMGLKSR